MTIVMILAVTILLLFALKHRPYVRCGFKMLGISFFIEANQYEVQSPLTFPVRSPSSALCPTVPHTTEIRDTRG